MLSRGHCRRILAKEKQEIIATVSMKTNNISFCSQLIVLVQSVSQSPLAYLQYMSRWIYTLSTVVLSKSTHNHEVAAMYLPLSCWLLARLFENEELRTDHYMIHFAKQLFTGNEQTTWTILPAEPTDGNWISTPKRWNPPQISTSPNWSQVCFFPYVISFIRTRHTSLL